MWNLKKEDDTNQLVYKTETESQKTNSWHGGGGGGIGQEPGTDMYTRLCIQQTNKRPYCIAQGTLLNTP